MKAFPAADSLINKTGGDITKNPAADLTDRKHMERP